MLDEAKAGVSETKVAENWEKKKDLKWVFGSKMMYLP